MAENGSHSWPAVTVSDVALRSRNPIRRIIEGLKKPALPEKPHIPLSIGASGACDPYSVTHPRKEIP